MTTTGREKVSMNAITRFGSQARSGTRQRRGGTRELLLRWLRRASNRSHADAAAEALAGVGVVLAGLMLSGPFSAANAAVITVDSVGDLMTTDGECTLREAIALANSNIASPDCGTADPAPTQDVIEFAIPGTGVHTIQPTSVLPAMLEPMLIDGYSQPGAAPNTLQVGNDAVLLIEIDGSLTVGPLPLYGLQLGNGCEARGLVINRSSQIGVLVDAGPDGAVLRGNFLGLDPTGAVGLPNVTFGAFLRGPNVTLGGLDPGDRNVVAGSAVNVVAQSADGMALNNYVGVDAQGAVAIGGSVQGFTVESSGFVVGSRDAPNVISGHTTVGNRLPAGIALTLATAAVIEGNRIGTDATGTLPIPNSRGVYSFATLGGAPFEVTIGSPDNGNLIAFNLEDGVVVESNDDFETLGIAIRGNSIHSNGGLGIDLGDDGVDANDPLDVDDGPNLRQNAPMLTVSTFSDGSVTIDWQLDSSAASTYTVDFYAGSQCDPAGYGEGEFHLGWVDVTTDLAGTVSGTETFTAPAGSLTVTATATDEDGNTSEFSNCLGSARALEVPVDDPMDLAMLVLLLASLGVLRLREQ